MKVEVVSKEYIIPSSPTPEILKNYKLSILDQLVLYFKSPFVLFYDSTADSSRVHELKKSLSQTLSLMYPLAGRLKEDKITIECNDEGVEFIEAHVDENMSYFLDNHEEVTQLIPFTGVYEPSPAGKTLAVIQLNRFKGGGTAICLVISHGIADAASTTVFFNTWAAINRGCTVSANGFVLDYSRMFPPVINSSVTERLARTMATVTTEESQEKYEVRRFVFPGPSIAQLREQLLFDNDQRPSRTEALTAFVWAAVIRAANKKSDPGIIKVHELSTMVNLRGRMDPPFPPNCLGNVLSGATIRYEGIGGTVIDCHSLVKKVRDSQRAVNEKSSRIAIEYMRSVLSGTGGGGGENQHQQSKEDIFRLQTSSLLGFPYYNTDFGWGKPRYVLPPMLRKDSLLLFIDTKNGGVEAWIGLPKEIMNILLQDHRFLKFVSAFPKSKL